MSSKQKYLQSAIDHSHDPSDYLGETTLTIGTSGRSIEVRKQLKITVRNSAQARVGLSDRNGAVCASEALIAEK